MMTNREFRHENDQRIVVKIRCSTPRSSATINRMLGRASPSAGSVVVAPAATVKTAISPRQIIFEVCILFRKLLATVKIKLVVLTLEANLLLDIK